MPKVRFTSEQWERAKTLFELGKSLSEIQNETGIDRSYVNKKALKEKWSKGFIPQIVDAKVKNIEEKFKIDRVLSTLSPQQQSTVVSEAERILQGKDWYAKAARKVAARTVQSLDGFVEGKDFKSAADALVACMKAESLVPYYAPTQKADVKIDINEKPLDPLLSGREHYEQPN